MTANPVVNQPPQQRAEQPATVALMVRLVRESFAVVEPHAEHVAEAFYANWTFDPAKPPAEFAEDLAAKGLWQPE